ncbi:MAG: N-acetyl-gamma-glutamyl-phosphate reductase [Desulfobacterota bacterium]|nr:N-acetyl-gamma-glutamyl-phosphate reductase [Thermodesulfobacteriota bacterium]
MDIAIIGASGYTGLELIRILSRHPHIKVTAVTSERFHGQLLSSIFPSLEHRCPLRLEALDLDRIVHKADLFFTAVPHTEAMRIVPHLLGHGKKVIDLSADFRLKDQKTYETWYAPHTAPHLLPVAVYGLPELNRASLRRAHLVANPGCYPTSIILPLMPLLKENMIRTESIIIDAKSGVSGAGRSLKTSSLFCETSEGCSAYNVLRHRHQPEIEEQLSRIAERPISIVFSPHLIPMNRGMLSTIYVTMKRSMKSTSIRSLYTTYYRRERFIRILPDGTFPHTGRVRGSNMCDIGFAMSGRRLVVMSAIDNLMKGASGQAVQNMNIMLRCDEHTALEAIPLYP